MTQFTDLQQKGVAATGDIIPIRDASSNTDKRTTVAGLANAVAASSPFGDAWAAYTPTTVGWASSGQTIVARFKRIGSTVILQFNITGTSNSTSASLTLPTAARIGMNVDAPTGFAQDSGTAINANGNGRISIDPSSDSSVATVYSNMFLGSWTSSGTKTVRGTVIYEAA